MRFSPHHVRQDDRRADEPELLAQPPLDEPLVRRIGPLMNSTNVGGAVVAWAPTTIVGLLPAAHRLRVLGHQPAEEGVETTGGDPGLPALQGLVERRGRLVLVRFGDRHETIVDRAVEGVLGQADVVTALVHGHHAGSERPA